MTFYTGVDKLFQLASALLTVCDDAMTEAGVPPSFTYVYGGRGAPPAVCASLVVGPFDPMIYHGVPAGSDMAPMAYNWVMPRTAILTVYSYRCLTGGLSGEGMDMTTIIAANMTADAQLIFTDGYVLHEGIVQARIDGVFTPYTADPKALVVDAAQPLEISGGIGGCAVTVRAELS